MPVEEMPSFSILVIVLLMLIGGCIGATSGGIKVYRVLIMAKNGLWNIVGILIFMAHGYTFQDSIFEFASAIGTSGL